MSIGCRIMDGLRQETEAPSAQAHLRAAIQAQHAHLEDHLQLGRGPLTLSHYVTVLRCFYPVYAHLETAVAAWAPQLQAAGLLPHRWSKLPLLQRDLQALGATPLHMPTQAFAPSNLDHVWGCLYVLEGATLGGQWIVRRVAEALHLGADSGSAFFAGYGAETGRHWKQFCAALNHALAAPSACNNAVDAARATFELFDAAWQVAQNSTRIHES